MTEIAPDANHAGGLLAGGGIFIARGLDTDLPLAFADIRSIVFAGGGTSAAPEPVPDGVETANGDRFAARVDGGVLVVRAGGRQEVVSLDAVRVLDVVVLEEGQAPRVQVVMEGGGSPLQGGLITPSLAVETRWGERLAIPAALVSEVAFGLGAKDLSGIFSLRQGIPRDRIVRDRLRDGTRGPLLVRIPGGEQFPGDLKGDGDADEKLPRRVGIGTFAIGAHEVTFAEHERFCRGTRCRLPDGGGWGRGRRPVVNVSWQDAQAYAGWLSGQTGNRCRLPSGAEWEYAARAGPMGRFWWGDEAGIARADCEGCGSLWDGEMNAPVGRFDPNPYSPHDTAGNVFEWVADCFRDTFAGAPADGSPREKPGCGKRVIRGGAWSFPPREMRSANRWRDFPARSSDDTGFRLARDLAPGDWEAVWQ